ncbi:hypothetical protein HII36_29855 [Nonomuraea sp. NN258]|uniref:hypothetical protein n=1 Tax=Nonomuraea antri TaxID=2730852 RepID=UPI001568BD6F|nr:hypothetical protein [Nonomuraea antri]NRQ36006.1 hypothetical protein [Nonomuraea antri]
MPAPAADVEQLRQDLAAARAEIEELHTERVKFAGGYLIERDRADQLEAEVEHWLDQVTALGEQLHAARLRRPLDYGVEFDIFVGPYDTLASDGSVSTRWQVRIGEWPERVEVADEARPYKAAARLREFIGEAQEALTVLEGLGVYREDLPAVDTPAGGAIVHCPALPCAWRTTWDSQQEAADAQRRHVVEEHDGDPRPAPEHQQWRPSIVSPSAMERGW